MLTAPPERTGGCHLWPWYHGLWFCFRMQDGGERPAGSRGCWLEEETDKEETCWDGLLGRGLRPGKASGHKGATWRWEWSSGLQSPQEGPVTSTGIFEGFRKV